MSTLVEQIKQGLARLEHDPSQRPGLTALVATARQGVAEQLQIFRSQWPVDPEITSQEAASVEGSLFSLTEILAQLGSQLQRPESLAAQPWVEAIDASLAPVQLLRARPAPTSPTSNGWVNRALIHLEYTLQQGSSSEPTRKFLATLAEEEDRLSRLLESVPEEIESELRAPAESLLGIIDLWIECAGDPLPTVAQHWPGQILQCQQRFDRVLADYIQAVASQAPTSFPVLNLILAACSGPPDPRVLAGARALCPPAISLLRAQIDAFVQEQAPCQQLFALLEQGPGPGFAPQLEDLAHQVAQLLAVFTAEEPLLELSSEASQQPNLPPLLSSLLALARQHVLSGGAEAELRQGVARLQALLKASQNSTEAPLKLARQDLGKVVLLLQELLAEPGQESLQELGFVLEDCVESLGQLEREQMRS